MMSDSTDMLGAIACGDASVLEALTETSLNTLEASGLDLKTYTMVRIAALVAMDAQPVSYALTVEAAMEALDPEEILSLMVALAPVVGSAKVASATLNVLDVCFDEIDDDGVVTLVDPDGEIDSVEAGSVVERELEAV